MISTLPLLVVVLVIATVALTRSSRDVSAGPAPSPEPALPAPPQPVDRDALVNLARRETWRLVRHPAVVIGYVLSAIALLVLCGSTGGIVQGQATMVGISAFPLAGLTLVAANLAPLRSRRFSAQGMVDTTAVSPSTRIAAHIVSTLGPATVFALMVGGWFTYLVVADGPGSTPSIAELAKGPVLVLCAGVCGVLIASWVPTPLVAAPAVVLLGFVEAGLATPAPAHRTIRWLAWWVPQPEDVPVELWDRRPVVHLGYLLSLAVLVAAVAIVRSIPRRTGQALLVASVVLVVAAGFAVTRPVSDATARRLAAWVNEAPERQRCTEIERARLCAYPEYDFRSEWATVVEGVVAAVPVKPTAPVRVVQRLFRRATEHISPSVVSRFTGGAPRSPAERWPADGAVHPELRWDPAGGTDHLLAVDVAQVLVGLPVDQDERGRACTAADQARAVVALWLAGHGSDDARRSIAGLTGGEDFGEDLDLDGGGLGYAAGLFPVVGVESWLASYDPGIRWSVRDARVALKLLATNGDEVRRVLREHWDEVLDPSTTTDDLAAWFDIEPGPSIDEIARDIGTTAAEAERFLPVPAEEPGPYAYVAASRGPCP
jgi:hypothetical protein